MKETPDSTTAKPSKEVPSKDSEESDGSDSSGSMVEIRLNEYVKKSELSDFDLRSIVVRCSSCNRQINHYSYKDFKKHRKLGVITCKECYDFYGSSEFSQDESGYNYCTWCGNGGKLVVCDYCPNGFCSACIRRNFGRGEITVTNKEGWKCYVCDQKRLKPKITFCDLIINMKEKSIKAEKKKPAPSKKTIIAEKWLQAAFDSSEEACKNFHRKMTKLKSIGVAKSKSLKHIVKKMEEIINAHKDELKQVTVTLTKNFDAHIEQKRKEQDELKNNTITLDAKNDDSLSDCIVLDPPSQEGGEASDSSTSLLQKKDKSLLEKKDKSLLQKKDKSLLEKKDKSLLQKKDKSLLQKKDKSEEEKIQAKLSLLKSSSESDEENEEESPMNVDHPCNGEINASKTELTPNKSDSETATVILDTPDNKAARKLTFSCSGSSDSEGDRPKIDEIVKEVDRHIEEQDTLPSTDDERYNPDSHPKLKQEVKINVIRCDRLLKDGQPYVVLSGVSDAEDKIDKIIDSLCKFPRKKRVTKPPTGRRRSGPFTKAAAKKELLESSSSISLSSEDEDQKKIQIEKKNPLKPKNPEIEEADSDSSSISLNSDSEKEETNKKGKKPNKKKSDDSSDDFVPTKKKKKYDKLLHGRLSSDEGSDSKPKEKKEKKGTRKRKLLSSDEEKKEKKKKSASSDTTSSSEEEKGKKQTKKRRRIKKVGSSSDEDGDGSKDDPKKTPGAHRKNIQKILSKDKLAGTTKEAQLEEKERRKRIQERQRLYNKMEDFSADGKVIITRKMVLEVDPDSKEELVQIHPDLVCKLKPHQVEGVKFMWECTIESTKDLDKPGSGCILAHCMGLGKTLQVIAFLHTCLTNKIVGKKFSRGMIICPYNTALNWATEFNYWLDDIEGDVRVHQITSAKSNLERLDILNYWFEEGGVVILSYDIFRRLSLDKIPKTRKKDREQFHKCLLDPGPDIVVCDEGHILKNEKSGISIATSKLATRRRIVLTGTPLQNNLAEYHCMLSFVKPNLLGTVKEFRNRFVNPIINGQYDDSDEYDVKLMKKRIHILHKLLEGCVQRCDYSALTKFLPPKHEFVISVKLSEIQMKMYECYLEKLTTAKLGSKIQGSTLFVDFNNLRHIWTHPFICHVNHLKQEEKRLLKDDDEEEFINDESVTEESASSSDESDDDKLVEKIKNDNKRKIRTRSAKKNDEEEESEGEEDSKSKQWYHEFISEEDKYNIQLSGKIVLLLEILKECERIGDKIILFSQSLLALDFIEDVLFTASSSSSQPDTEDQDVKGTWIKGLDYFRMDGGTSADFRKSYIDMFNDPSNDRSRLFLISTKAGSLGTNLIGANRVIIFDTSWNPSHDVQAIFRVYRFGQLKPVYIYRLLAQGTMEEKIYDRQVTKLSLSCRVVDEQQIDRHFSAADLAELYTFDRNATTQRPTPMVPKDRLLAELLIKNKDWIITYHEHDSLLQSQNEEDLTEEERQAAWNEYETERDKPATNFNANTNTFDLGSITKEPDFSQDYEGKMIPDMKEIVNNLFERLKAEIPFIQKDPLEFKKKLLTSVYAVRQAFQEKHVKILRLKQEYCTRGTVPNAVNKYMDELGVILKSSGEYITRLSTAIVQEQKKLQQQQTFKQTGVPPSQQTPIYRTRFSNAQPTGFPAGFIFRGVPPTSSNRMFFYPQNSNFNPNNIPNLKTYMTTPTPNTTTTKQNVVITEVIDSSSTPDSTSDSVRVQPPIITEVDDSSSKPTKPSSANSANHQSTVVIEEIS